jgi:ABC-2 type transport system permease protein
MIGTGAVAASDPSRARFVLKRPSLGQQLVTFAVLADKTARSKLTYRLSTLLSLIASGFAYCVFLLVWLEVYRENPQQGPISRDQMLAYLVVAFLVNSIVTLSLEFRFMQRVRMGLVTADLLRPLGFMPFQLAQGVGDGIVNLVFALPIGLVGGWFVGRGFLPPDWLAALGGVISLALAFLVSFGISYLIVQAAFVLQSGYGVLFARAALHQVFSGLAAPLVMFPEGLRTAAAFLPFRHTVETPALIWLGQVPASELAGLLLQQAAWAAGLLLLATQLFGAVMRRHQVQGG